MAATALPRLVVAGLSGESGKTLVTLALSLEARRRDLPVRAFKKGPDYIDAAWLEWASGKPARNLDTHLMGFEQAASSFAWHGISSGLNLVEGNRGLFDGLDARGTHSTAELAKALHAPVVLVIDATKVTRTVAALVLGCQKLDPELRIAGVIVNRAGTSRHARIIREAIETVCGIPVLGVIPRASPDALLSTRHLGLVTPREQHGHESLIRNLSEFVGRYLEFDRLVEISQHAGPVPIPAMPQPAVASAAGLTIGYVTDSAFSFYYPENIEALHAAGATVAPISALSAASLPDDLDTLYIGGGFPETHAQLLSNNTGFLASIRQAAQAGLPVYAECGGLMLLSRALIWRGTKYPMAGVFPFDVQVFDSPQGHGYTELLVDTANPFFPVGARLKGHEFHYSRIVPETHVSPTACAVLRGTGCFTGRDAVLAGNVYAAYTHLHALATPDWARGIIGAARSAKAAV